MPKIFLKINPRKESERVASFIRKTLKETNFSKSIIAVSGGIDSITTAYLVCRALGPENVYILFLPYKTWHKQAVSKIDSVIEKLKINKEKLLIVPIDQAVDAFKKTINLKDKLQLANLMARVRMIYLYYYAKKLDCLVCGTENKSEYLLGYYTRFGDEASDLEPIKHLYKTQVWQLAEYLEVSAEIIRQEPSADLWQGQTDENELGFSYNKADPILYLYNDKKRSKAEIIKAGFNKMLVEKVIGKVEENQYKHLVPYSII